jgi:O-antigen/teichoic acid export membrane protein
MSSSSQDDAAAPRAAPPAEEQAGPATAPDAAEKTAKRTDGPAPEPGNFFENKARQLTASFAEFRSLLRLRPFDTSSPEGRSKERYRRAALTTLTSMLARGLGTFTGIANLRIALGYLGKERYGLWMAVGSLITWANLADLGLARGLQNHLSQANGRDDTEAAGRYVSTGLIALSLIALALGLVAAPVVFAVPWAHLLNIENPALAGEARNVVGAVVACFLIGFPLSLVPTIYAAYQRGYIANLFSIVGSLVSLTTLLLITRVGASLSYLVLATGGVSIGITLLNFAYVLREMPWLRPRWSRATRPTLRALGGTSAALFVFQLGSLLVNETQSFIIARRLGLSEVTEWTVFMRVYVLPAIFIQMLDTPLIPAFREAHVRGEQSWLRTAFWRITKLKMVIAVGAAGLYPVLGNWVAALMSGQAVVLPLDIWAASGFLLIVAIWNGSFNDLMIAVDRLRLLVITVLVNGLVTPVLSYWLAPSLGLLGVVLATPLFSLFVSAWLLPLACRDLLKSTPTEPKTVPS